MYDLDVPKDLIESIESKMTDTFIEFERDRYMDAFHENKGSIPSDFRF